MVSDYKEILSDSAKGMKRSAIRELLKLTQKPEIISFAGGLPAKESFPLDQLQEICAEVIATDGAAACQYGSTEGVPELREIIAKRYDNELDSYFKTQKVLENCQSARALYTVQCHDRDELMVYLKEHGIPCGAYYPRPVNTQTAYEKWNTRSLPVCEKLAKTVLSIPMHPYLTEEAQDYVIATMNEFAAKKKSQAA